MVLPISPGYNALFAVLGNQPPIFDGTNGTVFAEVMRHGIVLLRVFCPGVLDSALRDLIVECFVADHVKEAVKKWRTDKLAEGDKALVEELLKWIVDNWKATDTPPTSADLVTFINQYRGQASGSPVWNGLVPSVRKFHDRMRPTSRPTDHEVVIMMLAVFEEADRNMLWYYITAARTLKAISSTGEGKMDKLAASVAASEAEVLTFDELQAAITKLMNQKKNFFQPNPSNSSSSASTPNPPLFNSPSGFSTTPLTPTPSPSTTLANALPSPVFSFSSPAPFIPSLPVRQQQQFDTNDLIKSFEKLQLTFSSKLEQIAAQSQQTASSIAVLQNEFNDVKRQVGMKAAPDLKFKQPLAGGGKTVGSMMEEVNVMSAVENKEGDGKKEPVKKRCFYCARPGHFKMGCELKVQDQLAGAPIIDGTDGRLYWKVQDEATGVWTMGGPIEGHIKGARHRVFHPDHPQHAAVLASVADVDFTIEIETNSFEIDVDEIEFNIQDMNSAIDIIELEVSCDMAEVPLFVNPPSAPAAQLGEIQEKELKPEQIQLEEVVIYFQSLNLGGDDSGIPVKTICREVLKMREEQGVNVLSMVKRVRDVRDDSSEQLPRIVLDGIWPPQKGTKIIFPKKESSRGMERDNGPKSSVPATAADNGKGSSGKEGVEAAKDGNEKVEGKDGDDKKKKKNRNKKKVKVKEGVKVKEFESDSPPSEVGGAAEGSATPAAVTVPASTPVSTTTPITNPVRAPATTPPTPPPASNPNPVSISSSASTPTPTSPEKPATYRVQPGFDIPSGVALHIIEKLFSAPIGDSMTWGEFFAFSPRGARLAMDRLRSRRIAVEQQAARDGMEIDVKFSEVLASKADRNSDMFDHLLSALLDVVDGSLDKVAGLNAPVVDSSPFLLDDEDVWGLAEAGSDVVDVAQYWLDTNDILSFSTEATLPPDGEGGRTVPTVGFRKCKVIATCPRVQDVEVGFGDEAEELSNVLLDCGSQIVTIALSVWNKVASSAGVEEGATISMRGAHGHSRRLYGLVPRLPVTVMGLRYYIQAFIVDDINLDVKPPYLMLLGQPFLEVARAENFWTRDGDMYTRLTSQTDLSVTIKFKTVDCKHPDNQHNLSGFVLARRGARSR
ncbi:hypothetical protein HDU76_007453, partial [Blyttiomyces sp. JEL0837]